MRSPGGIRRWAVGVFLSSLVPFGCTRTSAPTPEPVVEPKQSTTHDALKSEDYESVTLGMKMTVAEVEKLLGPGLTEPPKEFRMTVGDGGKRKPDFYRWWWDGKNGIVIAFVDGKVWMKGTNINEAPPAGGK